MSTELKTIPIDKARELVSIIDSPRPKSLDFNDRDAKIVSEDSTILLATGGKELALTPPAVKALLQVAKLPVAMQKRFVGHEKRLASTLTYFLNSQGTQTTALTKGRKVIGFADPDMTLVSNEEVIDALEKNLQGMEIDQINVGGNGDTFINAVSTRKKDSMKIGQDDWFQSGVTIKNNPLGNSRTQIEGYLRRLVCLNGMIVNDSIFKAPRVIESDIPSWLSMNIRHARNAGTKTFASIEELKSKSIDGNLADFAESLLFELDLPVTVSNRLIQLIVKQGAENMYDVMNHLTFAASHFKGIRNDPNIRNRIMSASGHFVTHVNEVCDRCHRTTLSRN